MPRKKTPDFQSNGLALCYLRVSTAEQAKAGLGLMSQGDICAEKAKQLGLDFRDISNDHAKPMRDGHFVDAGLSASKVRFEDRAAGGAVMDWIEAGDSLIVSRLDRAWRNVADFVATADELTRRGVRLVVCYPQIDLGTAIGRAFAQMLAVVAEWESNRKGERIRDALAAKKTRQTLAKAIPADVVENLPSDWRPSRIERSSDATEHKPGRIFVYIRCSHRESVESGLGLIVQATGAKAFADSLIAQNPNLTLAEAFTDAAVSASKFDLRKRPAGKRLDADLQDGDHVVFSTLDRGFRCVADMAATLPDWIRRGVHVHFAGEGLSMDDPQGRMMANIIVTFAQMEAELCSDRAREARAQNAIQGKFVGGRDPAFWKVYRFASGKKLVLDRKQLVVFRLARWLKNCCGMSVPAALERCEELLSRRENRPALPPGGVHPNTKLSSLLPDDYPRDKFRRAFPYLTRDHWNKCVPKYDQAIEAWRNQAAMLRARKQLPPEQPAVRVTRRGWQVSEPEA